MRAPIVPWILLLVSTSVAPARADAPANVVFIHPDGASLSSWGVARTYWVGPDADLAWDRMPFMAAYRGHMSDRLGGTSNGGATSHAFGVRVRAAGSFGRDGAWEDARPIRAASGYDGSLLREAANTGHPVGLVNDGDLPEPGTGVFWAEAQHRDEAAEIARQFVDGRPGHEGEDVRPVVALGGGEAFFLPAGAPPCGDALDPDCAAHVDPLDGATASRTDGRNLIRELLDDGWVVLRTRTEFEACVERVRREPDWTPRVLGLFAASDVFNDTEEEDLIAAGLIRDHAPEGDPKAGRLVAFGSRDPGHGHHPPRAEEMHALALELLRRHAERAGKPFFLVTEIESVDNFGNGNNAAGMLLGLRSADRVIDATLEFVEEEPRTFVLTAADSDASAIQIVSPARERVSVNPTGDGSDRVLAPTDGRRGRGSEPFISAPDASGRTMEFTIAWAGTNDFSGGVLSRFAGHRAEEVQRRFAARFDNTDVYRVMRAVLLGEEMP